MLAGGGWFAYQEFLAGGGPQDTAEDFFRALDSGDVTAVNSLVHPESPLGEVPQSQVEGISESAISVQETSVLRRTDSRATVSVRLSVRRAGSSRTTQGTVEMRQWNGDWRVWQVPESGL